MLHKNFETRAAEGWKCRLGAGGGTAAPSWGWEPGGCRLRAKGGAAAPPSGWRLERGLDALSFSSGCAFEPCPSFVALSFWEAPSGVTTSLAWDLPFFVGMCLLNHATISAPWLFVESLPTDEGGEISGSANWNPEAPYSRGKNHQIQKGVGWWGLPPPLGWTEKNRSLRGLNPGAWLPSICWTEKIPNGTT